MTTVSASRPVPARSRPPRPRGPAGPARAATIDPFRVLRRHLLEIATSVVFGGVVGVAAWVVLDWVFPLYSAEVLFEIQPGVQKAGDVTSREPMNDENVYRIAKTQTILLTNRDVLLDAVDDPDVQQKTAWFTGKFIDDDGSPLIEEAVDELEEDVRTTVMRGTELFELSWSAHDARDVPIVLNAIANAYMDVRKTVENSVFNSNLELFKDQFRDTNLAIDDLDQEIKVFIRDKGITSLDDPRYHQASIALQELTERIADTQAMLSIAHSSYLQTAAKLEGEMEPTSEDQLEAEMDFSIAPLVNEVQALKVELRVRRETHSPDHPTVEGLDRRLRAAEVEKQAKIDQILRRNLEARLKAFSNQIEQSQRSLEDLEDEIERKDLVLRELAGDQSEYDAMRTRREHLELSRDADVQLIKEIQLMRLRQDAQRVRIAEEPKTPRELAFPKPEVVIPLGMLLVVGLTIGFIFVRELTDQRVKTAADLMILPDTQVLGVIPDIDEDPTGCEGAELVLKRFPNSVVAESYRQACGILTKEIDRAGYQTLVLMSGLPAAGTTTAATNLAAGLAAIGRNVIVVDANFRRPRLAEIAGVDPDQAGLGDYLADAVLTDEVIVEIEGGLSVIPAGSPGSRVIDRLSTDRLDALIAELRSRYDLIVFDAPPAVVAGDAMVLANKVDAAVVVVRAHQEQRGLVARLIAQLADTRCSPLGILLNRPRGTAGGYFKKNFATMAQYAAGSSGAR